MEHFFELDDGGGYGLSGHGLKIKGCEKSALLATRVLQSKGCRHTGQITVFSCGGFIRQHFQKETG